MSDCQLVHSDQPPACAASPIAGAAAPPADEVGAQVWKRVWAHRPAVDKDNALLQRESRSPRFRLVIGRLESTFGRLEGLRTIELGSGRGDLSALLAQRGADVTLLDNSAEALREARWRFDRLGLSPRYEMGDILESLDSRHGRFDVSISLGVVEHFKDADRTRVIRAHLDVLVPGGLAVISVPHAWCLPYRMWKLYLELRGWWPYGMELPYSKREIIRRADEAGFARTEAHGLGFWQSVGDHWGKSIFGRGPDWVDRPSCLDRWMGSVLLLFAWRGEADADTNRLGN